MAGTATGMEALVSYLPLVQRDDAILMTAGLPLEPIIASTPAETRWPIGIKFQSFGCRDLTRLGSALCAPPSFANPGDSDTALETFSSFQIYADEKCSTRAVDLTWLQDRAVRRMSAFESAQLGAELLTGSQTGNKSLESEATVPSGIAAPLAVRDAIQAAEEALAGSLHGAKGFLHMSPGVFTTAQQGGGLIEDEATEEWETPSGHRIVADAGYDPATAPAHPGSITGATAWIYTSAPVYWIMGPPRWLGADEFGLDLVHDTRTVRLVRDALVIFDPCATNAIPIGS